MRAWASQGWGHAATVMFIWDAVVEATTAQLHDQDEPIWVGGTIVQSYDVRVPLSLLQEVQLGAVD